MKKFRFLYIAAAALLFAACANEEDGIGNSSPVAATIQANISKTVTRATVGNTWSENDAIGVYASSGVITKENNKKYVTTKGDGTFEAASNDNIIYFKDNKETTFSAYYQRASACPQHATHCVSSRRPLPLSATTAGEIGRASCRERV